jgi:pyruvate dehydrogenase phosphatase
VLGRWDPVTKEYFAVDLSVDQTGFNEVEVARIKEAHPGEDDILDPDSGRLLGMAVTRAFGDHRWKWDNDFVKEIQYKFFGDAPRPQSKTPPYMTAEPVVEEMEIMRGVADAEKIPSAGPKSDFLIMASDGLWDRITSENAVQLVHSWLEARERGNGSVRADPDFKPPVYLPGQHMRPPAGAEYSVEEKRYLDWAATPEYFSIEDENAAVCLARNALGGSRKGLLAGMMAMGKWSRNAFDDTTIMVVFFDKVAEGKEKDKTKVPQDKHWWWPW